MQTPNRPPTTTNLTQIPAVFIWTKVGAEAGQSIERILHRKELERQAGHGLFCWGIGNALGSAPRVAREQSPNGNVEVLFTKMKSPPKAADVSPSSVLLWVDYEDANGHTRPLPDHILTTSRGDGASGRQKTHHYALMCHASSSIATEHLAAFDSAQVANLVSSNPVGASQVTSVVRYHGQTASTSPYSVFLRASLHGDGVVRLKTPVVLSGRSFDLYRAVCEATSSNDWMACLGALRTHVCAQVLDRRRQLNLPLYA